MRAVLSLMFFLSSILAVENRLDIDTKTYRHLLDEYYQCLGKRELRLNKSSSRISSKYVVGLQFGSVQLDCFDCLSPNVKLTFEQEVINRVRPRMKWQYKTMRKSTVWKDLQPTFSYQVDPWSNMFLGKHVQLRLYNLSRPMGGWYNCIDNDRRFTGQMFFLDVLPFVRTNLIDELTPSPKLSNYRDFPLLGVSAGYSWSKWTACDRCGFSNDSERRRQAVCYIARSESTVEMSAKMQLLEMFTRLPCHSSLLVEEVHDKVGNWPVFEQVQQCQINCSGSAQNRVINEVDASGNVHVKDILPPDEFSASEGLPPLPQSVVRQAFLLVEHDPFVLSCPLYYRHAKHWRRNGQVLTWAYLQRTNGSRVFVDFQYQLRFTPLHHTDTAIFSCWSWKGHLLSTVDIVVQQKSNIEQTMAYFKLFIVFGLALLMFVFICTKVL